MHLKVLRFLKQCLSSDLLLDSLWCVELQTPHKQKEMRRNCHRKILEKKISVLMKVFGSQILVCHDVRLQVEIPPIQLGFVAEKSKFHTCTKGGRCVIIFFCKILMFRGRLLFFCSQQPPLETALGSVVFHFVESAFLFSPFNFGTSVNRSSKYWIHVSHFWIYHLWKISIWVYSCCVWDNRWLSLKSIVIALWSVEIALNIKNILFNFVR